MNILTWMLFGGLSGWIATLLFPNRTRVTSYQAIILGVVGAFVGGMVAKYWGHVDIESSSFDALSFLSALFGAMALLAFYYRIANRI